MYVFRCGSLYKVEYPFYEILLFLLVLETLQENRDRVLFDAHFLQDCDAETLVDRAICLVDKDFNHLVDRSWTVHHDVLDTLECADYDTKQ